MLNRELYAQRFQKLIHLHLFIYLFIVSLSIYADDHELTSDSLVLCNTNCSFTELYNVICWPCFLRILLLFHR